MIRNMNIDLNPHREIYLMAGLITNSQSLSIKEQSLVYPFLEQLTSAYIRPHYDLILDEYEGSFCVPASITGAGWLQETDQITGQIRSAK